MAVEIEIEEGLFQAVNTVEQIIAVASGIYMTQDASAVYIAAVVAGPQNGFVYRVLKNNFLAVPLLVPLTTATDVPTGIDNDGTYVYVLSRAAAPGFEATVTRILKSNFAGPQNRVVGPIGTFAIPNQRPIVDGTDLIFTAVDSASGTLQGIVKLDLVGFAAFTFAVDGSPNVTLNSAVLDLVNGRYWIASSTILLAGPCSPAVLSVSRPGFIFQLSGCGAFPDITRWPCLAPGDGVVPFVCDGSALYGADVNVVPNVISRLDVPLLAVCIATALPGVSQCSAQGVLAENGTNLYVADNQAPSNVFRYSKVGLALQATHTLPAPANNAGYILIDAPNQFVYVLTTSGTSRLVRFGFGLL